MPLTTFTKKTELDKTRAVTKAEAIMCQIIPSKSDLCRAQSGTRWTTDKMAKLLTILLRDINMGKQVC